MADVDPQSLFEGLHRLRDAAIAESQKDVPHSVVIPFATYAPWRLDNPFLQVYQHTANHTLVDVYRCWELWQLVGQVAVVPGDILEVGVWRGGTASVIGGAAKACGIDATLYLADTFSGVVKAGEKDTAYKGGEHADASLDMVESVLRRTGVSRYEILCGIFPERTAAAIEGHKFRLCHIDVDVYKSAQDVFDWIWPRLSPMGIVVFDDYGFLSCEGVTRLVNELARRPDALFIHNLNGHALLIKRPRRDAPSALSKD